MFLSVYRGIHWTLRQLRYLINHKLRLRRRALLYSSVNPRAKASFYLVARPSILDWEVFLILGSVFDPGKCFWILGSVFDPGKCF